jgi:acetolactate synthase-1/2/3 large subunit
VVTLKIAEAVIAKMSALGIGQAFSITGGAAMHLNDAAGEFEDLSVLYMHNEQACAMAAEGYARISRMPALVIATAGPGAINTLNGVFGAFTDSIPMVVLTGQARKNTQKNFYGLEDLRQLGDQEAPMLEMVRPITKAQLEITESHTAKNILDLLEEIFLTAVMGRPGPVWIEIPVDVQGKQLEFDELHLYRERDDHDNLLKQNQIIDADSIFKYLEDSKKPVLLLGTGVLLAGAQKSAIEFAERFNIPILTAWAHDVIPSTHPLFMGRPGTIGTRPGNFILQQSDLLITVGSRLNIRQTSYNYGSFAPKAFKIYVDIDESELKKPFPATDLQVESDAKYFFDSLLLASSSMAKIENYDIWVNWCRDINESYSVKSSDYSIKSDVINAYHLIPEIFLNAQENSIFVCGNATACIVPFQTARLLPGMSLFSNSGSAPMGYDLPAAIGASLANPNRPVVCFAGDGSIMMNIQELQTLASLRSDFTLVVLDNGGYLSIKQTQSNFFGRLHGTNHGSGVTFPDFAELARAFGLDAITLKPSSWKNEIQKLLLKSGVRVIVAKLDEDQEFMPRIKSRVINGEIRTPELDDMFPHISDDELLRIRKGPVL